jgi:hypothetical protein
VVDQMAEDGEVLLPGEQPGCRRGGHHMKTQVGA